MKVLLLGKRGQVGHELCAPLGSLGELTALGREDCDFDEPDALSAVVQALRPQLIVNAVAYNDVDGAQRDPTQAEAINHAAVRRLGELAKAHQAGLIHISTDYVFDGEATLPYPEDAAAKPLNAYGASKRAGELALEALRAPAIVLRTAWVFSLRRKCFLQTMLRLALDKPTLRIVSDQYSSPTFCRDLASSIACIAARVQGDPHRELMQLRGIYHCAGAGVASRVAFAEAAFAEYQGELALKKVIPITAEAFAAPAPRPRFTALDCSKLERVFGIALPTWRDGLRRALADQPELGPR